MSAVLIVQSVIAFLIRLWFVTSEYKKSITNRVEISTPLNSWKRVTEGVYMLNENVNPYVGDVVHETPLNLYIYKYIIQYSQQYLPCIFIVCDILTAYFLYLTARKYLTISYEQECITLKNNEEFAKTMKMGEGDVKDELLSIADKSFLTESTIKLTPSYVFAAYLFNPFVIFNCVATTTTVFSNLFLAIFLCLLVHRKNLLCCLTLAISATQTFYSVFMIFPILLNLDEDRKINKAKIVFYSCTFGLLLAAFQYISYLISGDWNFIENIYGFILLVPDSQPNIGVFWYICIEVIEIFRAFFTASFQINVTFLYLIPLSIRFRKDPVFLAASLIILTAIFKSCPSLGDVGFCLSLICFWTHLFSYFLLSFPVMACFLVSTVLGPVVWHLWIYSRSANANFFFGQSLSFAVAQILLLTDLLAAYLKKDFLLRNSHVRNIDSEILQWSA